MRSPGYYLQLLNRLDQIDPIKLQIAQLSDRLNAVDTELKRNTQEDLEDRKSRHVRILARVVGTAGTGIVSVLAILLVMLFLIFSSVEEASLERGELKTRQLIPPEGWVYLGNAIALAASGAIIGTVGGKKAIALWLVNNVFEKGENGDARRKSN